MNVLVIGRGGREHALAWKMAQSKRVEKLFVAPGNDGMTQVAKCIDVKENDHARLVAFAKKEHIDLTVIGPEQPLADGIVNRFREAGLTVFGPTQEAALIESSKSYAKQLMQSYGIPTAASRDFTSPEKAKAYVEEKGAPIVVKADGLASGKGVTVARTKEEAIQSIEDMMEGGRLSGAGRTVVIEEYLTGEEFSLMAFVHGETVVPMEVSRDHKRAFDGDRGPNTGGMGAYSPVPQLSDETIHQAVEKILQPAAQALVKEGRSFSGVLYAGLIATVEGPKVIEFNARFGDPETQVVLPRMQNDLVDVMMDLLSGKSPTLRWRKEAAVGIVLASGGYPGSYKKDIAIAGLETLNDDTLTFLAGIKQAEGRWASDGGRILLLAREAATIGEAKQEVYREMKKIKCEHAFYRKDIGDQAVQSLSHNVIPQP